MDELTKERYEYLKGSIGRISSHFDSEVRGSENINKRIDQLEFMLKEIKKDLDKHDRVLFNDGRGGLVQQVDRLIQALERNKNNVALWLAILAILVTAAEAVFELIRK